MKMGDKGPGVEDWQSQLNLWSELTKAGVYVAVTGEFDYLTSTATMKFQESASDYELYLEPTGAADEPTLSAMSLILDQLDAPKPTGPVVQMPPLPIVGKTGFPWGWALFFGFLALAGGSSKR